MGKSRKPLAHVRITDPRITVEMISEQFHLVGKDYTVSADTFGSIRIDGLITDRFDFLQFDGKGQLVGYPGLRFIISTGEEEWRAHLGIVARLSYHGIVVFGLPPLSGDTMLARDIVQRITDYWERGLTAGAIFLPEVIGFIPKPETETRIVVIARNVTGVIAGVTGAISNILHHNINEVEVRSNAYLSYLVFDFAEKLPDLAIAFHEIKLIDGIIDIREIVFEK